MNSPDADAHEPRDEEASDEFERGEWNTLLAEGEKSGPALDGKMVLAELRELRARHRHIG